MRVPVRSRLRAAVTAVSAVAAAATMLPTASAAHPPPPVPELAWTDCGDGFECATAAVPLDHRRPQRATIDLAVIRHPALDPANRIGTLFVAHPLGSIEFLRGAPPGTFELFARFDVVGYDGRGTGPTQIDCGIDEALLAPFGPDATRPGAVDRKAMVAAADEYGRRCLEAHGDLLPHMTNAAMARDLDLLRAAVGDEQLTYIGISQGADLGATYTSMFPGRTRAMVLDAPVDAAGWRDRPLEIWREQNSSYEDTLDRFFLSCAAHQDACGFGGDDPERAFDALMAQLDEAPIPSSNPDHPLVDGLDLRLATDEHLFDPVRWPALADALVQAQAGDGTLLANVVSGATNNDLGPSIASFVANMAVHQRYPRDLDENLDQFEHSYGMFDHFWPSANYVGLVAHRWPAKGRGEFTGDYEHADDAAPVLVIGGTHDPATPYQWAERLTLDLGNARLITYESEGHGGLNDGNPCLLFPVATYIADPSQLPPEGYGCEQTFEPFAA